MNECHEIIVNIIFAGANWSPNYHLNGVKNLKVQ